MNTYFVKSFEEDFSTKTLDGKKKITFQTLDDILLTNTIKPNTKSFGQKRRLSTTILHKNYTKTYRPQGIIFQTTTRPNYILPFDLVLLSDAKEIVVHYYRIKNNLHEYYNHKLIDGYKKFIFKDITLMLKSFDSPRSVWKAVNDFRNKNGHSILPKTKYRLVEYNEAVFLKPVKIKPVALFGYKKEARALAHKYGLKYFKSAKDFYERTSNS
ncbi:MAG: hypothetical protein WCI52_02235 [bacterium]